MKTIGENIWEGMIRNNQGLCASCDNELPTNPIQHIGVYYCDKCGKLYKEIIDKLIPEGISFNLHDLY